MIGQSVTMQDLNFKAGEISSWLNEYYNQAVEIKQYIEEVGVAGLVALGFTEEEATTLQTAFNDLAYQKDTAFDSSQAVRKLYGLGIR
jgi:Holliday junction resolvasome RuvABC DNA-binding subunit